MKYFLKIFWPFLDKINVFIYAVNADIGNTYKNYTFSNATTENKQKKYIYILFS